MPAEARTYGIGSSEMRVLLSTYGSRGDVEPMVGLAVRLRALGTEIPVCAPPSAADLPRRVAEGRDALAATGVMPAGVQL
jgi:vancomycin aglycone glucosyltransferase